MTRTRRTFLLAGLAIAIAAAIATPAAAQDYARYRIVETRVIENMWAGPAQSAALLSPDGSRLLHLGHRNPDMCLFAPAQIGSWAELACADYTDDNRPGPPEDMLWSPDGRQLLMPTFNHALLRFEDTDIRIFDPATFTVRNLTDDGFDGPFAGGGGPAEVDILAQWGSDRSIFFVRHSIPAGGFEQGTSTSLMTVGTDGGAPQKLLEIESSSGVPVWNFAVSADARLLAYSLEDKADAENAGLYLLEFGDAAATRVTGMEALEGMRLTGMAFSADDRYLLLLGRTDGGIAARVLDIATGEIIPVDPLQNIMGVAWSPTGSALAYVTYDRTKPDMPGGLFLSEAPGRPGRLLIGGAFYPPVCCGDRPFVWASNDTLVLSQTDEKLGSVLYVQLGE